MMMVMARRLEGVVFVALVAMAALLPGSAAQATAPPPGHPKGAVTYTVGDSMGWTIPTSGAATYQAWASNNTFEVGDILVFNFNNGAGDVAEVTKPAFDSCNGANTLSIYTVPPARINLTTAGQHFFISTIPGRCSSGQKVAINVITFSPSGAPPPSTYVAPPPSTSVALPPKAATPSPSAATPRSSAAAPALSPSTSAPSSSAASPPTVAVTPAPSTASLPPKAATPSPSAALPPSSMSAPPFSTLAPSSVAASPAGVAVPPAPGNSAASLGVTGVSAVILTAAVALFAFP